VPQEKPDVVLEERKLALEERKWEGEIELRRAELEIKRRENDRFSRFFSPLTTTVLAGVLTLAASATAALLQGSNTLTLEREKFVSSKQLETQKQQHELVLKMIGVPDQAQAKANLQFLAGSGLIDQSLAEKIQLSASKAAPLIPPPASIGAPSSGIRIESTYDPPKDPANQLVYERFKRRRVLEEAALFLSSLKLPRKLVLKTAECGAPNSGYDPQATTVTICYELLRLFESFPPADTDNISRDDVIAGPILQLMIRGMSQALIDLLQVPLFGSPEDAVDALTEFVLIQFGTGVVRRGLNGTAYFVLAQARRADAAVISNVINARRLENYLCVAYGSDRASFKDFVDRGLLPETRAQGCTREYESAKSAFSKTILPFVDQDLMKKVQSLDWIKG
jgi:Putative metallopeptidase